ncbi:hypothetical protein DNL40_04760 [Xylanimonas oleitrophica]|uniref:G5 domain-containing protein n=1 Tax=Xylanimonas oleitrophica TaxID=2607479 RepID=A0A2W5WSX9_9MICO|nr:G5 domain-containing protein [Xylanimonas oleitrophica]PZR54230.1 hypothetical protein DNL40_04760 [Xylanimonas oleitrophica]
MNNAAQPAAAPQGPQADVTPENTTTPTRRRLRRLPVVAGLVAASLAASGGALAYGNARKTVTLDVDGQVTTVATFAGSVDGLLQAQGVRVGDRDAVTPAADERLTEGADVVVRYGRELTLQADGQESQVWVTALDADEALSALSSRGGDVALVASRSADRSDIGLRLDADKPVAVVADGETRTAEDGAADVEHVLDAVDVELGEQDRVRVTDAAAAGVQPQDGAPAPGVAVVVQRVAQEDVATEHPIGFETQTTEDGDLYEGESKVVQEGKEGVRTVVERVVTVDGQEESREVLSDDVTAEPVAKIVAKGTKERPAPQPVAPRSSGSSSGTSEEAATTSGPSVSGSPRAIGQQLAAARGWTGEQWSCLDSLFQKESGWNPSAANPSSGAYGIPQALPGSKMGSVAGDWRTNPATQITWGLNYIEGRYGTPCGAWSHSQAKNWY